MKYILILFLSLSVVSCIQVDKFCESYVTIKNDSSHELVVKSSRWEAIDLFNEDSIILCGDASKFNFGQCDLFFDGFVVYDRATRDTLYVFCEDTVCGCWHIPCEDIKPNTDICLDSIVCIEFVGYDTYTDGSRSEEDYRLILTDSIFDLWRQSRE